jgi:hypothetical protein
MEKTIQHAVRNVRLPSVVSVRNDVATFVQDQNPDVSHAISTKVIPQAGIMVFHKVNVLAVYFYFKHIYLYHLNLIFAAIMITFKYI